MSEKKMSRTHRIVLMAMLAAIQIVLSRFLSINLWNLKIGFSFVPIALAGMLLGPVGAGLTGMVANTLLEIYTLMFGWNMYEAIWDVLAEGKHVTGDLGGSANTKTFADALIDKL